VIRLGRGVILHIAPSNVPVNFAYSMVAGILSGNVNIVRVPSKPFEQIDLICDALKQVSALSEFDVFNKRLFLIKYDRSSNITSLLSSICDIRVIWGGDETIAQIRKSELPPRSYDITFADRYSLAAINADKLIDAINIDKVAEDFYNDTYLFDQNGCSAPHLILWTGKHDAIVRAKEMFWKAVQNRLVNYEISPILSVDKLSALYLMSTQYVDLQRISPKNNKLWRINIRNLSGEIDKYRCAGGYFLEYDAASLNELSKIVTRKYQTLSYYGFTLDELHSFVRTNRLTGVDRIVPLGKTTEFCLTWDGHDLIRSLSRECTIQ